MAKHIFVAEKSAEDLKSLITALENSGYETVESSDGKDALKLLNVNNAPQMIILGNPLDGLDTLSLCKEIKSEKRLKDVPIIIIKDEGTKNDPFLELGITAFIPKPLNITKLLSYIKELTMAVETNKYGKDQKSHQGLIVGIILIVFILIFLVFFIVPMIRGAKEEKETSRIVAAQHLPLA